VLAARKLGMTVVPVIQLGHLTEAQRRALVIADNQLALNAGWSDETLRLELQALQEADFDLSLVGFDDEELARLLAAQDATEGLTDEDAVPDLPEAPISVPGDLWRLGSHVLLVGDATNKADVARLMDGHAADCIFSESGISGRDVHQRFFGHCTAANGKIVLLREALNVLAAADGMFPGGIADVVRKKAEVSQTAPIGDSEKTALATAFIEALRSLDAQGFQKIMTDDVFWTLPGSSLVSGVAHGVEGILKRAKAIVERGVTLEIMHVVSGYEGVALLLHNTGKWNGKVLDEYLTTVCTLRDDKIARLDTYISDIPMVNDYFV
jgi:ketosteroid isomerase-like protein